MLEFVLTSILMVALSVVLYLMVRALPRIAEDPAAADEHGILDRWAHSHFPEKIDKMLNGALLKFLRRLRVVVLRVDNSVTGQLQRLNPRERDKKSAIDFKEIAEQNKEGENPIA